MAPGVPRARPRIRRAVITLIGLVPAVLGAACGGREYTYVSSADTDAYFKVPSDWARFNKKQLLIAAELDESEGAQQGFKFLEAYDGAPEPSIDHVLGGVPTHPIVFAQVRELSRPARDQMSLLTLRNSVYPVDQFLQQDQADLISYDETVVGEGFHGVRMVYNLSLAGNLTVVEGNQLLRVSQIALLDPATQFLYLFVVRCNAACYEDNQRTIEQIVNSYTVKER